MGQEVSLQGQRLKWTVSEQRGLQGSKVTVLTPVQERRSEPCILCVSGVVALLPVGANPHFQGSFCLAGGLFVCVFCFEMLFSNLIWWLSWFTKKKTRLHLFANTCLRSCLKLSHTLSHDLSCTVWDWTTAAHWLIWTNQHSESEGKQEYYVPQCFTGEFHIQARCTLKEAGLRTHSSPLSSWYSADVFTLLLELFQTGDE